MSEIKTPLSYNKETGEIKILLISDELNKWAGDSYTTIKLFTNFIEEKYKSKRLDFKEEYNEELNVFVESKEFDTTTIDVWSSTCINDVTGFERFYNDLTGDWVLRMVTKSEENTKEWKFKNESDANSLLLELRTWKFMQGLMPKQDEEKDAPSASKG